MVTEVTFNELCEKFSNIVDNCILAADKVGIITFNPVKSKWPKYHLKLNKSGKFVLDRSRPYEYKLVNKSYYFFPYSGKYFDSSKLGSSLYACCLDGTDNHVDIGYYIQSGMWKIETCYLADCLDHYRDFCVGR